MNQNFEVEISVIRVLMNQNFEPEISVLYFFPLTLLHSERPKLHTILAFLSAIELNM